MKKLALMGILCLAVTATPASAATVGWKGRTWTVGASGVESASATVNGADELVISVENDPNGLSPAYDNWAVYTDVSLLGLNVANGGWIEISFRGKPDVASGGPRAFVDTSESGTETMFQSGHHPGFADLVSNSHTYVSGTGWVRGDWFFGPSLDDEIHTMKVGLRKGTGEADFYLDGTLLATYASDPALQLFETVFLGVTADSATFGATGSGVYTDFQYGTGYAIPEPLTMLAVFGGCGALGGYIRRRRTA
jgi:hypothetical protein